MTLTEREWSDVLAVLPENPETADGWELSLVRRTVERILTERLAQAWKEGARRGYALYETKYVHVERENPYLAHADSGRSTGALSDEQGSARVGGSLKPCHDRNSNVCVAEGCYGEACIRGRA